MIPVSKPYLDENDIAFAIDALSKGELSGTFGEYTESFEREFAELHGVRHGVAVTSGTTALQLAVKAAGVGPGDEVLISASTNIATALAVVYNGATPIPVDSEEETWNLNLNLIESMITARTKAILPVHLYGHPVDMDRLVAISKEYGLKIIEDCAEAHGAKCRGRPVGGFGDLGCFSFYANKIITTGEGGMIVTDDDDLAARLRLLRNLAFAEPRFMHKEIGYNFRITGIQSAIGLSQTRRLSEIIKDKRRIAKSYSLGLDGIPFLTLPNEKDWAENVYWMYAMTLSSESRISRDELLLELKDNGIETRTFFCPMNLQPCLDSYPLSGEGNCPVAERIWRSGFYVPSSHTLRDDEIAYICSVLRNTLT
jgi:perosamine synthetase